MRVLVCGSRDWDHADIANDKLLMWPILDGLAMGGPLVIIEGGALGADSAAALWATERNGGQLHKCFKADWKKYGRAAGPIRNKQMLDEGMPDVVLAFVNKPLKETKGTKNMVEQAKKAGIPVFVVERV